MIPEIGSRLIVTADWATCSPYAKKIFTITRVAGFSWVFAEVEYYSVWLNFNEYRLISPLEELATALE